MKYAAILFGLALVLAATFARASFFQRSRPADIHASGTIEATESDVAPKVQGRLNALRVRDGAAVRKGEVLAWLEQIAPALNDREARANVAAAQAQVAAAQAAY